MRRIFTHLNSRFAGKRLLSSMAQSVFPGRPGLSHFGREQQQQVKTSPNDLFKHLDKRQTQTLKQKSCDKLCQTETNSKFVAPSANLQIHGRWRWGTACSMPRVSGIDGAYDISAHNISLSNSVVQVMRVWSLPALLSPLAKLHIRYGVTQPTAYRILHRICGVYGIKYHARVSVCLSSCAGRS